MGDESVLMHPSCVWVYLHTRLRQTELVYHRFAAVNFENYYTLSCKHTLRCFSGPFEVGLFWCATSFHESLAWSVHAFRCAVLVCHVFQK